MLKGASAFAAAWRRAHLRRPVMSSPQATASTGKAPAPVKDAAKGSGAAPDAEEVDPIPNLAVADAFWRLSQPTLKHLHDEARKTLLDGIRADGPYCRPSTRSDRCTEMGPFLESLGSSADLGTPVGPLLEELKAKNAAELKRLDDLLEDARTNLGETDLSAVLRDRALYLARIGEKERALEAYDAALEKVVGLGSRIDLRLAVIRIAMFHGDQALTVSNIAKAKECGGLVCDRADCAGSSRTAATGTGAIG